MGMFTKYVNRILRLHGADDASVHDVQPDDMINLCVMWLLILEKSLEEGDIQEAQSIVTHLLEIMYGRK